MLVFLASPSWPVWPAADASQLCIACAPQRKCSAVALSSGDAVVLSRLLRRTSCGRVASGLALSWNRPTWSTLPQTIESVSAGFTSEDLLQWWDSGVLLKKYNRAIADYGHGRLRFDAGDHLDIGGSTGGVSRRLIDGYVTPDSRVMLEPSDTIRQFPRWEIHRRS